MVNNTKIYIYDLIELNYLCETFPKVQPEMDLFDLFLNKLTMHYQIVHNIEEADMAFIPVDYVKLIYIGPHDDYSIVPENCPPTPPTHGIIHKENTIKFFWDLYVKPKLNLESGKKHFLFYPYVLYDINFSHIPIDIVIFNYECMLTLSNYCYPATTNSKLIPVPYPLNNNVNHNQQMIYKFQHFEKKNDISFFGSLDRTEHLKYFRTFLKYLKTNIYFGNGDEAFDNLKNTKYLMVLRGDTPTRLCFYQCFAFGVIPIIFENELYLYKKLILDGINISESCLILPNINNNPSTYAEIVDNILTNELSSESNYLNKVKNHEKIFDNINWYGEGLCKPVENIINYMK